jgi:hypothetical protein
MASRMRLSVPLRGLPRLMVAATVRRFDFVVVWVAVCPVVEVDADELEPFGLERRRSDIDLGAVDAEVTT